LRRMSGAPAIRKNHRRIPGGTKPPSQDGLQHHRFAMSPGTYGAVTGRGQADRPPCGDCEGIHYGQCETVARAVELCGGNGIALTTTSAVSSRMRKLFTRSDRNISPTDRAAESTCIGQDRLDTASRTELVLRVRSYRPCTRKVQPCYATATQRISVTLQRKSCTFLAENR
jgi:hypothetical protein